MTRSTPAPAPAPLKHDAGKARWDLLPLGPVAVVVAVLSFGSTKYTPNGWQREEDGAADRYYAAVLRHLVAWRRGEATDPESGLPHLAHAACGLLFLLWLGGER